MPFCVTLFDLLFEVHANAGDAELLWEGCEVAVSILRTEETDLWSWWALIILLTCHGYSLNFSVSTFFIQGPQFISVGSEMYLVDGKILPW